MSNPIPARTLDMLQDRRPFAPVYNLDRYGFAPLLASRLGLKRRPRTDAEWLHGWSWWDEDFTAGDFRPPEDPRRAPNLIVANPRQREALLAEGYRRVRVGGLPLAYARSEGFERRPGALLAFPPHSSEAIRSDVLQNDFLDELADIRREFEGVWVSIFYLDFSPGLTASIARRGLKPLLGADPADLRSMRRSRAAFEVFDAVVTNNFGSHIAYALAGGCRVRVSDAGYHYPERLVKAARGQGFGARADRMARRCAKSYLKRRYGALFSDDPLGGMRDPARGREWIGADDTLEGRDLKSALGWTPVGRARTHVRALRRRLTPTI